MSMSPTNTFILAGNYYNPTYAPTDETLYKTVMRTWEINENSVIPATRCLFTARLKFIVREKVVRFLTVAIKQQ